MNRLALIIFCFAAIYIIWGSTYLAIAFGLEGFEPWTLTSLRFLISSGVMFALTLLKKESSLTTPEIRTAIFSGILLIGANGLVCVSETTISSGTVAIVIGTMPIWVLLLNWLIFKGPAPSKQKFAGAIVGLLGLALIIFGSSSAPANDQLRWNPLTLIAILFCCAMWASGTILQRKLSGMQSAFKFSGLQMLAGGTAAGLLAIFFEQPWSLNLSTIKMSSLGALAYLIFFGSVVSYTAYGWLARNFESSTVSTYALVNPVVAVILGAVFRDEIIDSHAIFALGLVLLGIFLLLFERPQRAR